MTAPSQRFIRSVQLIVVLTFLYQLSLLFRGDEAFLSRPFLEDSFYALSVARSISDGTGFSVDGVHPTNGVQPLVCLFDAPLFALSGENTGLALRLVYILNIGFYLFAAWMIAGFMRALYHDEEKKPYVFWSVFGLIYANYVVGLHYLNGLETALAGGLAFAALWYQVRIWDAPETGVRNWLVLGVLFGLAVLARIDLAFLVVAMVAMRFVRAHLLYSKLPGRERWGRFMETVREVVLTGGTAVLVSSPWWIFNYRTFGSLMPISGQSQQWLLQDAMRSVVETFNVLSDSFLPGLQTPVGMRIGQWAPYGVVVALLAVVVLALLPGVRDGVRRLRGRFPSEWNWKAFLPFALFCLMLLGFYTFMFRASHFQSRYLILPRIGVLLGIFSVFFSLWNQLGNKVLVRRMLVPLLFLPMLLHFAFFARNFEDGYANFMVYVVQWIDTNVGPDQKVGMFQSGTTGFVYPDRVVNLDGKVNSGALHAFQRGELPRYVDSAKFEYIIDWDLYTGRAFSDPDVRDAYHPIDTLVHDMIVWERIAP